ncbi:class I SAM-dependent methyltransferase [Bradyrhizobium sp. ISRA442]|uniref:class I SAM-dependent methyltransferase n=1 Tax=Bradyrhizobium sp. ISRA442 TaxID=2866197 RepID=UPI00311B2E86
MTSHDETDDPIVGRLLSPALRCAHGHTPENVALVQLFMAASCANDASRALDAAIREITSDPRATSGGLTRLERMRELWDQTPDAFANVKAVTRTLDHPNARDPHPAPATWGTIFDAAASVSHEASVALYSLGRADLLRAASDEIVEWMRSRNLLAPRACVLDIGCGSGRMTEVLAPHVKAVIGTDVSMQMLQAAHERCADLPNTHFVRTSGHGLSVFKDASVDLACAVDVFPYFVMSGVAQRHFSEAARVLRPGGHLIILNFAYDSDPVAERGKLRHLAQNSGLSLQYSASREFTLWDGTCFLMQNFGA